jgi:hypothetical protein
MAVELARTRRFTGHGPTGEPMRDTTFEPHPRPPESAGEWVEHRIAALGPARAWPAGRLVQQLLTADGDKAIKAAVDAAAGLDEYDRWSVWRTLEVCRGKAGEFPAAVPVMDRLCAAWVKRWGSKEPKARPARELPMAGTSRVKPRYGIA